MALLPLPATLATGLLAWHLWRRFTAREVRQNAAAILANGSADDLRKGFHQRRGWVRFWPWLGCVTMASLPMVFVTPWYAGALVWLAMGLLLAGYFARYFTPLLNLARGLPEWQASFDSASWPDAAAVKQARARMPELAPAAAQSYANYKLYILLLRTWGWCRLGAGVLALGAVALTLAKLTYAAQ